MDHKNRFGSPYDPSYTGKQQRPIDRVEQHRTRGCGDPACAMCNPATAAFEASRRGSSGEATSFFSAAGSDPLARFFNDFAERYGTNGVVPDGMQVISFNTSGPERSAGPPPSYKKAREAVKQWIVEAPEQSFDDVVGNADALEQLRDAIRAPVEHKALYEAYGLKMPRGALLSGPPGCGKTMFARAAASEMRRLYGEATEFVSISGSELQQPYVGVTEQYIKAIFTFAREYAAHHGHPLLVFLDEAEVLLPDRTGRVRRVAPWEESQVATFLAEMDGIRESGAFVLLATNRPEVIDQAVLRDGRCDFKVTVKRPDAEAVETIVARNFKGVPVAEGEDRGRLVWAAVEALYDPHRVIVDAQHLRVRLSERGAEVERLGHRHFLLEHVVSGAIAASIPSRAKRHAFTRDKAAGTVTGVTVGDVLRAVDDVWRENRDLDHSFAFDEFVAAATEEQQRKDGE